LSFCSSHPLTLEQAAQVFRSYLQEKQSETQRQRISQSAKMAQLQEIEQAVIEQTRTPAVAPSIAPVRLDNAWFTGGKLHLEMKVPGELFFIVSGALHEKKRNLEMVRENFFCGVLWLTFLRSTTTSDPEAPSKENGRGQTTS
jgi:hypothetical protein